MSDAGEPQTVGVSIFESTIPPKTLAVYKAVGDELNLQGYVDTCGRRAEENGVIESDWSAFHTQLLKIHSLGTVCYRWEGEKDSYKQSNLIEVVFDKPLQVVVCRGPVFHDVNITGAQKALLVKQALGLSTEVGLMKSLGLQNKAVLMEETVGEWELIFNREHLKKLTHIDNILATFEKSPTRCLTYWWTMPSILLENGELSRMRYETEELCVELLGEANIQPLLSHLGLD